MKNDLGPLLSSFQSSFSSRKDDGFRHFTGSPLYLGCETRRVPAEYRWDGLHRGESPQHRKFLFQCTLDGWGNFEQGGRRWQVNPGQAFVTLMPSRHVYYLPEESASWSFYYFTIAHPYLVERLSEAIRNHGPVISVPAGARLHAQSFELFDRTCQQRHEDETAEEQSLYDWMFAFERHVRDLAHPRGPRESLLEELRRHTTENLRRSFGVEELAHRHGMSRSHFSHHFKTATGQSPAACILDLRLAEVRRLLRDTEAPLKDIAVETGFADANHLCKAFRRLFHASPGSYRKRVR